MAKELYSNEGASYLTADITNSATSITVATGGNYSHFPTTQQFTVKVDSEYMLVTANDGSGNLTVSRGQEGTTAAAHSQGAIIFSVLTDGALRRLVRQSLGGTNAAARRETNYIAGTGISLSAVDDATNDKCDLTISATGGSSFGSSFTIPPITTAFTWVNQGTSTLVNSGNSRYLRAPGTATDNISAIVKTVPAAPWTLIINIVGAVFSKNYLAFGACVRKSTNGAIQCLSFGQGGIQLARFTNPTTFSATDFGVFALNDYARYTWIKINDDNTNINYSISIDGNNWLGVGVFSRTNAFWGGGGATPDQVGVFVDPNNNSVLTTINGSNQYLESALILNSWSGV